MSLSKDSVLMFIRESERKAMLTISFKNKNKHLYEEIYEQIKDEIFENRLKSGEKLPSKRNLANQLAVSVNTVDTAYSQLLAEGYVESVPKKGFFVCDIEPYFKKDDGGSRQLVKLDLQEKAIDIDFSPTLVDHRLFPYNAFRKQFKNIFNEENKDLLKKPDLQGDLALRQSLVETLYRTRGVKCSKEQIIIGSGTDKLLQTLGLIFGKEKSIILENPVYLKAYRIFKQLGNPVSSVNIDNKGIRIEPLKNYQDAAVYITPSHQFPLGISMPIDRRMKLLNQINKQEDFYIIEDDYDSEFRYNERPLPSLKSIDRHERVIYMGTFSKSIAPSMRVSYMVLPEVLLKRYQKLSDVIGSTVSTLEQKMIAGFIDEGHFEKHLNRMRKVYKEKHMFLSQALSNLGKEIEISGEKAGHHLLVHLKTDMDEDEMVKRALDQGVKVYPVSTYFINKIPKKYQSTVLLGYGALSEAQIEMGILKLKKAWYLEEKR